MQAQVVHHRKQTLPWIPMIVAALLVAATAIGVQAALRDRGTATVPSITSIEGPGVRGIGPHGSVRVGSDLGAKESMQKVGMVEAGVTNISGVVYRPQPATGGPHPRTKFAGSAGRDPALKTTIDRIEQAR